MAPINSKSSLIRFKKVIKKKSEKRIKNDSTDLVLYLNYLHFLRLMLNRANQLSIQDNSSEILPSHLQEAKIEFLKRFRG